MPWWIAGLKNIKCLWSKKPVHVHIESFEMERKKTHKEKNLMLILSSGMGIVFWEKIAMIYSGLSVLQ